MKHMLGSGVTSLQYVDEGKKEQARLLRKSATPAETALWEELRNCKVAGLKFRRQQVIEGFIADFFCESAKMVIEVDGEVHDDPERKKIDDLREKVFSARGLCTLRFKNEIILWKMPTVIEQIKIVAHKRLG